MKIMNNRGCKYFIGMPTECLVTVRLEDIGNGTFLSLSDNNGYRIDVLLNEYMKQEIVKELKKNGKKERTTKK